MEQKSKEEKIPESMLCLVKIRIDFWNLLFECVLMCVYVHVHIFFPADCDEKHLKHRALGDISSTLYLSALLPTPHSPPCCASLMPQAPPWLPSSSPILIKYLLKLFLIRKISLNRHMQCHSLVS